MTDTSRRTTSSLIATLLAATLLLAGCGSGDGEGDGRGRDGRTGAAGQPATGGPVEVREVTEPTADPSIRRDLGDAAGRLEEAGCSFGTYDEAAASHVEDGAALEGEDFPPTTGEHYDRWAPFGLYDSPVQDGYVVHNLEHGGVVAWLGTEVGDETREEVAGLLDKGEKWVVAPRPDIEGLFSAAWAKGLSCPPAALEALGPDDVAQVLDAWYEAVVSTGSDAEKDVPPFAGGMKEPAPVRDISEPSPF